MGVLGPAFTTRGTTAELHIPGTEIHFTAALGLRGKNRLYPGKDIYGCYFGRVRAFRTEYDDGLAALKIVKGYGRHILQRLTKIAHAATTHTAPAPTWRGSTALATTGAAGAAAAEATSTARPTWATCPACGFTSCPWSTCLPAGAEPGDHLGKKGGEFVHLAIRVGMHNDRLLRRQIPHGQCAGLRVNGYDCCPDIVEGSENHLLSGIMSAVFTDGSQCTQLVANLEPINFAGLGVSELDGVRRVTQERRARGRGQNYRMSQVPRRRWVVRRGDGYFHLGRVHRLHHAFDPAGLPLPNLCLMEAGKIRLRHHHNSRGLNGLLVFPEMPKNHRAVTRANLADGNGSRRLQILGARWDAHNLDALGELHLNVAFFRVHRKMPGLYLGHITCGARCLSSRGILRGSLRNG